MLSARWSRSPYRLPSLAGKQALQTYGCRMAIDECLLPDSTITVSLNTPSQNVGQPPSGTLTVRVSNVDNTIDSVRQLVSSVNGIINSYIVA
jgi:hypothetical protein